MHVPSGRWLRGFGLTLVTVVLWAVLPFVLKDLLRAIDPFTLSAFRLLTAGGALALWLALHGRLPGPGAQGRRGLALFAGATAGLAANYVLYLHALHRLTPGTAQLLIQLAPLLLLFSSLLVFRERLTRVQAAGAALLIVGFACFFNQHLDELVTAGSRYASGVLFIVLAALCWAGYGLAQKQLLSSWSSAATMAWVNLGCGLVLLPLAAPSALLSLSPAHALLLVFAAFNTLVAYLAFAEALAHWEASKVSATLAVTPVLTFAVAPLVAAAFPGVAPPEDHNLLAYAGAGLVVTGSAVAALAPSLRADS
jgi:drug/metabolite transporter (DMT)-like permease